MLESPNTGQKACFLEVENPQFRALRIVPNIWILPWRTKVLMQVGANGQLFDNLSFEL